MRISKMENFFCQLTIYWRCIIILLILIFSAPLFANEQSSPVICDDQNLIIEADQLPIVDLLNLLNQYCSITISGLKRPPDEKITYQANGPVLEVIKRLLRYLEAESHAFEFNGNQLTNVIVFSKGKSKYSLPIPSYHQSNNTPGGQKISAVKVLEIVPGSQAEVHGFQKGDYIIAYDSVEINSASQLVSEVQKKKNLQRVDLVLVRNKSRLSYVINSGLIGVRIQTVRVLPEEIH